MKHFALRVGLVASCWLVLAWVLTIHLCSRCATYLPPDVWLAPWAVTTYLMILILSYLAYLPVRADKKILGQTLRALPPMERKEIGLIIFNVRENTLDEVPLGLQSLCKKLVARGYVVQELASSIGIASMWKGAEDLEKTANGLVGIMGSTVRLVYGYRECLVGFYGSSPAFRYGSITPNFSEVVNALLKADFGPANRMT